jgi:2-phosphosulfolactate phosphatase
MILGIFALFRNMEIEILQLLEGARTASGLTVVIDVFRAFSTACYVIDAGAGPVYPVGNIDDAYALKMKFPGAILMGERNEKPPEGFDFGNSPSHIQGADICGKPVIHTTSSGTQGIVNAVNAAEIITGSFVNAGAIVRYIRMRQPEKVSLVCMGYACLYPTDEDTLCAEYISNELSGRTSDWDAMANRIRAGSGARFFEKVSQKWAPASDFDLCLTLNRFGFVLKAENSEGIWRFERIDI